MKKKLTLVVSLLLVMALSIGGTIAWLTDTETVTNTFTVGNIDITLEESTVDYKMIPGNDIAKDPLITVIGGSEDCWLFVEFTESDNLADFITYDEAAGWNELKPGVYYREVTASDADQEFEVLAGDKVTVKDTVTKDMMDAITKGEVEKPTLTFTAYAIQRDANFTTAAAAWTEVSGS